MSLYLTSILLPIPPHDSIAKQLHDSKIQLETQIRAELEAEYCANPQKGSNVTELENQLRQQLQQVTDERKRWQFDQEEINKKLINSQVQFGKVRDGFKSAYILCHALSLPLLTLICLYPY